MSLSIAPSTWLPVEIRSLYSNQQIKVGFLVFSTCAANMTFARPTGQVSTMDGLGGRMMGMEHARPFVAKVLPPPSLVGVGVEDTSFVGLGASDARRAAAGPWTYRPAKPGAGGAQEAGSVFCAVCDGWSKSRSRIYI